ncbi:DsbA family protein [Usitatibacter palustris]|uniref:Thioredoxin domain-containing protein n=1 Tax=Usitatibacter palustris TaxID=2732487 RepID=A0A6M4H347_9PROT|nr:thioredoxin domain-containing protein [Usitatibacter palustris]QJR13745.1 hypothetical protein DSM104440_00535 [Usitatibacter palustris]
MSRNAIVVVTTVVALAAFAAGAYFYTRYDQQQSAAKVEKSVAKAAEKGGPDANLLVRFHSPIIGPAGAPVTIVEFFDPACEACRAFHPYVKQILAAHPGNVRVVMRYVPFHGDASVEGVRILEAARAQGKFEPVLEALFESQNVWASHSAPSAARAWEFVGKTGLDVKRAREHAATRAADKLLELEVADVKVVGVQGTPTFFVNGKALAQTHPDALKSLVQAEVARIPAK